MELENSFKNKKIINIRYIDYLKRTKQICDIAIKKFEESSDIDKSLTTKQNSKPWVGCSFRYCRRRIQWKDKGTTKHAAYPTIEICYCLKYHKGRTDFPDPKTARIR